MEVEAGERFEAERRAERRGGERVRMCVHVCMCSVHVCMCTCACACACTHVCEWMCVHAHVCTCMCACVRAQGFEVIRPRTW